MQIDVLPSLAFMIGVRGGHDIDSVQGRLYSTASRRFLLANNYNINMSRVSADKKTVSHII